MGMWRAKQEESKLLCFRVPASLKQEFEALRQRAEAEGLDAVATFRAALGRLAKQLSEELPNGQGSQEGSGRPVRANGVERSGAVSRVNGARVES